MRVFAEQNLHKPYEMYRIYYERRLTDFEQTWRELKRMFSMISLGISFLLCPILYVFMQHILNPLSRLNDCVAKIADGEYEQQTSLYKGNVWNKDEIYELSLNISKMAKTIQSQITDLEEENEKKQQLMDNMAHELKTPLTSIFGYAEYLRYAKAGQEEIYEGLAYIMEESRRLSKLSETMLSMRIYEKETMQVDSISLETIADHIEKILFYGLQEKNLTLDRQFKIETIYGDEALLINLFRNLIENAIRASRKGGRILWNCRQEENRQIFEIIDFGIGIEQEELGRITEAFYRIDKARARKDGGVGLGLYIVDMLVKRMNGNIDFFSVPGRGTKVTVILQLPNKIEKSL